MLPGTRNKRTVSRWFIRLGPLPLLWVLLLTATGCSGTLPAPGTENPQLSLAHVEDVRLVLEDNGWEVSVTVRHDDSGWDHYADWWRITDGSGRELSRRVLRHPHLEEQPFTRSLPGVRLPQELRQVVVEAHCTIHGTGGRTVIVDLTKDQGPGFTIQR